MIIKNARVFHGTGFSERELYTDGERISERPVGEVLDAEGCFAIPGLIDIHFHGCDGYDFCDGTVEALDAISRYQARHGITAICPASMTLPIEKLTEIFKTAASYQSQTGAMFCGINMEGPFFSYEKRGAQNPEYLRLPDITFFERLQKAADGKIKIACIAPELEGAMEYIQSVSKQVKTSIAHTTADYDVAAKAIVAGVTHITHLFNAMPPFSHRAPGVVGAAAEADCVAELICDGIHVHPSMVRAALKLFGRNRIALISDSMMATGLDDGSYQLGGLVVNVCGNRATLADGTIAGSVTNLFDCMKTAVAFGIAPEDAVWMATAVPAREIGEFSEMGSLDAGKYANILLVDEDWNLCKVILRGECLC